MIGAFALIGFAAIQVEKAHRMVAAGRQVSDPAIAAISYALGSAAALFVCAKVLAP